jgi:uncharacterized repeat protein (TIGR01451 family)
MSRSMINTFRFIVLFVAVTAVLTLAVHATPSTQEAPRPRFNLEEIPYQPGATNPEERTESALATTAPNALIPWSKIAFQSYRDGNWNIYVSNDDGTELTAVTGDGKPEIHPDLNRGNSKIAYAANSGGDYEIFTANIDGSGKTAITNNSSDDVNPVWSPDGSKIVFESYRNGQADIYVMDANGNNQTRLTNGTDFDGMPTWSPDGSKIAFVSRRTGGYRIYVMNAGGGTQTQRSNQPYSFRPQWSPDGSQIAYDADSDGDGWQDLWRMNADGTGQVQVYNPSGQTDAWASSWSPDSTSIAFTKISFIQYNGNWYWTTAYLSGRNIINGADYRFGSGNTDWEPNWQTNDSLKPSSQINALPNPSPGPISVSWVSSDSGGSGIKNYDVQVKIGNGSWTSWLVDTTSTSDAYPGTGGQTVSFRVQASDNSFNNEGWPSSPDATTTVENLPPISNISTMYPFARYDENLAVNWSGSDPGNSGIQAYDVQYRINNGSWLGWQTDITQTTAVLNNGISGDVYDFRIRAIDNAQNQGNWSTGTDNGRTTFYTWGIEGTARDNAGAPVSDVTITSTPTLIGQAPSDINGFFGGYIDAASSNYAIGWSKVGYATLPNTSFTNGTNGKYAVTLPPANNIIADWGFESGGWGNGWQQGGTLPAAITDTISHTGQFAALLGQPTTFTNGVVPNTPDDLGYHFGIDDAGIGHLIFFDIPANGFSYQQLKPDNSWSTVEFIALPSNFSIDQRPEAIIESNGRIHLFWLTSSGSPNYNVSINHIQRQQNGQWSAPEIVTSDLKTFVPIQTAIESDGTIHLLYTQRLATTNKYALYYTSQQNNSWGTPRKLSENDSYDVNGYETNIQIGSDGTVHTVWVEKISGLNFLFYKQYHPVNGWQPTVRLIPSFTNPDHTFYRIKMLIDNSDNLHLFWENIENGEYFYLERRADIGWLTVEQLHNPEYQYIIRPEYAVSPNGELFFAYFTFLDGESKMILQVRDKTGVWQAPQELRQETEDATQSYVMGQIDLDVDESSTVHIVWSEIIDPDSIDTNTMEYQIIYVRKRLVGKPEAEEIWSGLGEANSFYLPPTIYARTTGQPTMLWLANSNAPLHYATPQASNNSGSYAFSTEVTIPSASENPVLSFLYDLAGTVETQGESFIVTVDNGSQVTTILSTSKTASWQHFWQDMAAWAGQTVTLTFEFTEAVNTAVSHVAIDEVTLGTSYPDLWISNSQESGGKGERVTHTLSFGNQGGSLAENVTITFKLPSGLAYRGSSLTPSSTSSQEITWQVGDLIAKGPEQIIEIELEILSSAPGLSTINSEVAISTASSELESLNNNATGTTYIGKELYLPLMFR